MSSILALILAVLLCCESLFAASKQGPPFSVSTAQGQWQLPQESSENAPDKSSDTKKSDPQKSSSKKPTDQKVIPLPIYSTLPNEGSTFGFMPVLLYVEQPTQRTQSIIAPSISWNEIIRFTTTFRWYYYPDDDQTLTLIPSYSSNINRNLTVQHTYFPKEAGKLTEETSFHLRRDMFYRFFGIGHSTPEKDETSYTRAGGDLSTRVGYNITRRLNVGASIEAQRQIIQKYHVYFLPLSSDVFPNTPGITGSSTLTEGLSVRYDTRENREFSTSGIAAELFGAINQNFTNRTDFSKISAEVKGLWPETRDILGAARVYWSAMGGQNIPFTHQNTLGGSYRLRGFTENRFVDYNAWVAELEQRITILQTHVYGVTADWRIDPFVTVGQVYRYSQDAIRNLKWAAGLGFRAFVQPNVLGRVDTAYSEDGVKVYVELGYPF